MGNQKLPVSVDIVIFTINDGKLKVLLVKRKKDPFAGKWAIPGGTVDKSHDSDLYAAARRSVREVLEVDPPYLEQVETFGGENRDPSGWTVSVTYFALMPFSKVDISKIEGCKWVTVDGGVVSKKKVAFDHRTILDEAIRRLQAKTEYSGIIANVIGDSFTVPELQKAYEIILGEPLNKVQFRRSIERAGILVETNLFTQGEGGGRPAMLYRLADDAASKLFFPRSILSSADQSKYPHSK